MSLHSESRTSPPPRPIWQKLLGIVILGAAGAGCGFAVARLTDAVLTTWEDDLALAMVVATVGTAVISLGVMATRPSVVLMI